ncbi:MAG: biotin/lipoyl-binding protein [Sulfurovum sp.]|nr:biotin/lipoyl-binding protein [Sulfurovaceae bacterium]
MDLILTLTYVALCIVVFKVLKVEVTSMTVTTSGLGGGFFMGWMYISMAYFHPYTESGQIYFKTSMIANNVHGKITKVYISDETPIKKDDPIYEIDKKPYLSQVKDIQSQLKLANLRLKEQKKLYKAKAGTLFDLEKREQIVSSLKAKLIKANFELEQTVIRAPADGHIVQNRLKVGTMAGIARMSSLGSFLLDEESQYIAAFRPNGLPSIKEGADAEIFFAALPGKVFKAKVVKVFKEVAEGQLLPEYKMLNLSKHNIHGRVPVELELVDDLSSYNIPKGSAFQATVFSDNLKMLIELRRILFRMFSWKNIINFEHGAKN